MAKLSVSVMPALPRSASSRRTAVPSRCGRGRPGSPAPGGCRGRPRRSARRCRALVGRVAPELARTRSCRRSAKASARRSASALSRIARSRRARLELGDQLRRCRSRRSRRTRRSSPARPEPCGATKSARHRLARRSGLSFCWRRKCQVISTGARVLVGEDLDVVADALAGPQAEHAVRGASGRRRSRSSIACVGEQLARRLADDRSSRIAG
jgi:hypothetical protein